MKVTVFAIDPKVKKFRSGVVRKARHLVSAGRRILPKKGKIEVYLIDDKRMRRLNKQFRKKNQPTNVLSFLKPKGFPGQELGEVYLDPIYIQKHKEDLTLMIIHGVLHILGYDHKKKHDRINMQKKERELWRKIS